MMRDGCFEPVLYGVKHEFLNTCYLEHSRRVLWGERRFRALKKRAARKTTATGVLVVFLWTLIYSYLGVRVVSKVLHPRAPLPSSWGCSLFFCLGCIFSGLNQQIGNK